MQSTVWGTLTEVSSGSTKHQLKTNEIKIGRKAGLDIVIAKTAISNIHCTIKKAEDGSLTIVDSSSNGCFINDTKMSKGATLALSDGDVIWVLHSSKVKDPMGFKLELVKNEELDNTQKVDEQSQINKSSKKKADQNPKVQTKPQEEKPKAEEPPKTEEKPKPEQQKKTSEQSKEEAERAMLNNLAKSLKEQITCAMCLQIMFIPIACHPCNHRLCGPCLSTLIKDKKSQCISCRKEITTAQRDSSFNSIIEDYLKSHPDEKRSKQEEEQLKKTNIFGADAVNVAELIHGKKLAPIALASFPIAPRRVATTSRRRGSDLSASEDDDDGDGSRCRQCVHARNGFQCAAGQRHVRCANCTKMVPIRPEHRASQTCAICDLTFCNLYHPPCRRSGNLLLRFANSMPLGTNIDQSLFRNNDFEFATFRNYINSIGIRTPLELYRTVIDEFRKSGYKYIVDRKVMNVAGGRSPTEIPLDHNSAVCTNCWPALWFQLVLNYRMEVVASRLPLAVQSRTDCYYGINCTTMVHKADHARKLNHCCFQTRF